MSNTDGSNGSADLRGTLVTGDFIIDQHIYEGERHHYADRCPGVHVKVEVGGAGILASLLQELFDKLDPVAFASLRDVVPARLPPPHVERSVSGTDAATPLGHHAYAFWRRCPADKPRERQNWRCVEAMGFGDRAEAASAAASGRSQGEDSSGHEDMAAGAAWPDNPDRPERPALVVLSEGGMGFRNSFRDWEDAALGTAQQIVFKTATQPTASPLWKKLTAHKERLTVVISAAELRKSSARISSGLTWEETFKDLLRELSESGRLHALTSCRNLIVTFDNEAAVAVQMETPGHVNTARVTFVYHPQAIEEDARYETSGTAFGFLTCFTAAVTRAIARGETGDLAPALGEGLAAMRNLLQEGHGAASEAPQGFPTRRIARTILDAKEHFTSVTFNYSEVAGADWTFLRLAEPAAVNKREAAFQFAALTAVYGPVAIANLPHLRIGDFISVDGEEITALRNLRQVVRRYDQYDKGNKPLSIGVFGPPGAGKSFAVKQIAQNLLRERSSWLEFNLSQFKDPGDLIGAFHQIRDQVLQGRLPVAFFDEFDSHNYSWLKYLLAPMQDGRFQEGELTHSIGKCILIFAGGTSWTFDTFGPPEPPPGGGDPRAEEAAAAFRLAKGPDFQSRLDAYLDVVGPNPRVREWRPGMTRSGDGELPSGVYRVGGRLMVEDDHDIWWPIRRALMLRGTLRLKPDAKLEIDPGLLHALLHVSRYRHGSRSMEKILTPIHRAKAFSPSFLSHRHQLELHTCAEEFLGLLQSPAPAAAPPGAGIGAVALSRVAEAIHDVWNRVMVRSGQSRADECLSLPELRQKWRRKEEELDARERNLAGMDDMAQHKERDEIRDARTVVRAELMRIESNEAAAARMPDILAMIGLAVSPGAAAPDLAATRRSIEFHLELLAAEEHRRWMDWYLSHGWTYHPKRDDYRFRHNCLRPYSELPEHEKVKDRTSVRSFPEIAAAAGFVIE